MHAQAGEQLAGRFGILGYLARELPAEIPALLELAAGRQAGTTTTIRRMQESKDPA